MRWTQKRNGPASCILSTQLHVEFSASLSFCTLVRKDLKLVQSISNLLIKYDQTKTKKCRPLFSIGAVEICTARSWELSQRLRMPTNQRLALLFNNAIGPEQEPMRARLTLLELELNVIRRSPAIAGDGPSFARSRILLHCSSLVIIQCCKENSPFSLLVKKAARFLH